MGSKSKGGQRNMAGAYGMQGSMPASNYGGSTMSSADAQQKYQADLAAWRAPTATGTTPGSGYNPAIVNDASNVAAGTAKAVDPTTGAMVDMTGAPGHLGVPTTDFSASGLGGYGPGIPNIGVMPTAPTPAAQRNNLAHIVYANSNQRYGGSSPNYGSSGGNSKGSGYR